MYEGTIYDVRRKKAPPKRFFLLISSEDVAGVDFGGDVVEAGIVTVGDDGVGKGFEAIEIVDDEAAEESRTIFERGFENDDLSSFGFDTLHDTLDRRLTEVIGVRFHRQTVDADSARFFLGRIEVAAVEVVVITGFGEDTVSDEVFAGSVGLDDGFDEVLGHVLVVSQELLGVLGKTITAITK